MRNRHRPLTLTVRGGRARIVVGVGANALQRSHQAERRVRSSASVADLKGAALHAFSFYGESIV